MSKENFNRSLDEEYLKKVSKYKLLTLEEEIELSKRIKDGDDKAFDKLVIHNLRLVIKIANQYINCGIDIEDLVAEGNIGLMKAAKKFDPKKETRFSTYAAIWIKQMIRRCISNHSRTIRLPVNLIDKMGQIGKVKHDFELKYGRQPTHKEISEFGNIPLYTVKRAAYSSINMISLNEIKGEDDEKTIEDIIKDLNAIDPSQETVKQDLWNDIYLFIKNLPEREREIIKMRYGLRDYDESTLAVIGKRFKISRERIRQLESILLKKFKIFFEKREMKERQSPLKEFIDNPVKINGHDSEN